MHADNTFMSYILHEVEPSIVNAIDATLKGILLANTCMFFPLLALEIVLQLLR